VIGQKSDRVLSSRYVLPQNLNAAIKQLNDQALDIAVHRLGPNGAFGWLPVWAKIMAAWNIGEGRWHCRRCCNAIERHSMKQPMLCRVG
jgi:hypothetical protein